MLGLLGLTSPPTLCYFSKTLAKTGCSRFVLCKIRLSKGSNAVQQFAPKGASFTVRLTPQWHSLNTLFHLIMHTSGHVWKLTPHKFALGLPTRYDCHVWLFFPTTVIYFEESPRRTATFASKQQAGIVLLPFNCILQGDESYATIVSCGWEYINAL